MVYYRSPNGQAKTMAQQPIAFLPFGGRGISGVEIVARGMPPKQMAKAIALLQPVDWPWGSSSAALWLPTGPITSIA
eukprot:2024527-Lingulodinium_polyedra.AAC.1